MAGDKITNNEDIRYKKTRNGETAYDGLIEAVDGLSMLYGGIFQYADAQERLSKLENDAFSGITRSFVLALSTLQNIRDDVFNHDIT